MDKELQQQLFEKFPKLFKERNLPMSQTCMCWGLEVGDGWHDIIQNMCHCIQSHIDNARENRVYAIKFNRALTRWKERRDDRGLIHYFRGNGANIEQFKNSELRVLAEKCSQVVFSQVKEKFGTLRIYYSGGDRYVDGVLRMAEVMSAVTCEECGHPGKQMGKGWIVTRCKKCAKDNS